MVIQVTRSYIIYVDDRYPRVKADSFGPVAWCSVFLQSFSTNVTSWNDEWVYFHNVECSSLMVLLMTCRVYADTAITRNGLSMSQCRAMLGRNVIKLQITTGTSTDILIMNRICSLCLNSRATLFHYRSIHSKLMDRLASSSL